MIASEDASVLVGWRNVCPATSVATRQPRIRATSSVCVPIEPVDPSTVKVRMPASSHEPAEASEGVRSDAGGRAQRRRARVAGASIAACWYANG